VELPQVITLPSVFNAAKALEVENISVTPDERSLETALISPP